MDIVRTARERGLMLVRFLWCGNDGTVRAKATALGGLEARLNSGIGVTLAMEAYELARPAPVRRGHGTGGRAAHRPRPDHVPRASRTRRARAPSSPTRSVSTATRRPVCQRSFLKRMEAALDARGALLRAGVRERVHARPAGGREMATGRLEPLLLDHRDDGLPGVRGRARRGARRAGHRGRPVLRRVGPVSRS